MFPPDVAVQLSSFSAGADDKASNSGHIAGEQMVALLVWVVGEGERERVAQPKVRL